eukprot:scaffold3604_cov275-Pinguiococcus_pyrenoidosus.AAC.6
MQCKKGRRKRCVLRRISARIALSFHTSLSHVLASKVMSENSAPAGQTRKGGRTLLGNVHLTMTIPMVSPNRDIFTGNLGESSPDNGDNDDDETVSSEVFAVLIAFSAFGGICLLVLIGALGYFVCRKTMGDTSFMRMEEGHAASEAQIY